MKVAIVVVMSIMLSGCFSLHFKKESPTSDYSLSGISVFGNYLETDDRKKEKVASK